MRQRQSNRRKQSGFTIGVDLGGTNVRAGLVNRDRLLKLGSRAVRSSGSRDEVLSDLCATIESVFDDRVQGIGIGVPSLVDPKDGVIFDTTNIPSWKKVALRAYLEKKFKVPVRIDNDANCFALGERHFGAGKSCENFVGLIVGTGLGAGILSGGKLHSGTDCGAGEFGSIPYLDGTIEHYASGQFFRKFGTTGEQLSDEASRGDEKALEIFEQFGAHLGFATKVILYSLAPKTIILGGSVSKSFKYYKNSLKKSLTDFSYPTVVKSLKFRTSTLRHGAVLGAASLIRDQSNA